MIELICISCPNGCRLLAEKRDDGVYVEGHKCKKGVDFAKAEITAPLRSVSSTVRTAFKEMPVAPVRTDGEIPKDKIFPLMRILNGIVIDKPLSRGDVVLENVADTGVNLIITTDLKKIIA